MEILLAAALLPAIGLLYYVYKKDTVEKEPMRLVVRLFVLGAVSGPLAAIVENIAFTGFEALVPEGALQIVLKYFVGVAAVEEGFKYLSLNTIRNNREFNYVFDGIVYAVAVSLGFAALENVLYVLDGGLEVALTRAIFSVPGHCADGVVMGCFFGLAKQREVAGNKKGARTYYILAFLLPVIEHGFYDAALSFESDGLALLALAVELVFIVFAGILVNHMSKRDAAIYPNRPQNQAGVLYGRDSTMPPYPSQPSSGMNMPGSSYGQYPHSGASMPGVSNGQYPYGGVNAPGASNDRYPVLGQPSGQGSTHPIPGQPLDQSGRYPIPGQQPTSGNDAYGTYNGQGQQD